MTSNDGARTITFTGRLQGDAIEFTRDVAVALGGYPGGPGLLGKALVRTLRRSGCASCSKETA